MPDDEHLKKILSAREDPRVLALEKKQGGLSSLADEVLNPLVLHKGERGTIHVNNAKK